MKKRTLIYIPQIHYFIPNLDIIEKTYGKKMLDNIYHLLTISGSKSMNMSMDSI